MDKLIQTDADIHCAVCGSNTRVPGYGQQCGTLQALWGYGSEHDGERYRVYLCESCFCATLAYLRQQRCINTLFDEVQPSDDQVFGLVGRYDFLASLNSPHLTSPQRCDQTMAMRRRNNV